MRIIHSGRLLVLCGVVSALLSAAPAMAAVDYYMTVTGARQGPIRGDAMSENIRLLSVVRDTPMAARMVTGQRRHSTITITKKIDMASPRFATALASNEALKTVTITFVGASKGEKTAQRIVLTNATILSVRKEGDSNEKITLDYQASEVTWTNGGKTMSDDWEAPN
ncbi:MAG: type VI secretion system tube protein TssD [Acidobacteriaceae bacterium]